MADMCHALQSIVITLLLSSIGVEATGSSETPDPAGQTLEVIRECMARSLAPWADEWKQEYIDTIRGAIAPNRGDPQYAARLEILQKGFVPYWEGFEKTQERSLFEVHRAQIRWYTEYLMRARFPTAEEKQRLRGQYADIWEYATMSLSSQFPFLDPDAVQTAKADHLDRCYGWIEMPLMPIYLQPISLIQVNKIKRRWDNLRYARVDLWRNLGGSTVPAKNPDALSINTHHHYLLTQRSLEQLLVYVWPITARPPGYYQSAMENRSNAIKRSLQSKRKAWAGERHIEKKRSGQLLQTEHISFLLAALLETPRGLDGSASVRTQDRVTLEHQAGAADGEEVVPMR